ncbi:MAG: PLP-dependent aminotransferase family protein [Armatimonadetes bacterium]|nr:PLP-dependent aminotransferase family protein [Armatimonadota bacterium]
MGLPGMVSNAPTRLYEQVAAQVRTLIVQKAFRPGDRLPSVRELSKQMSVSITTVLDAYRLLEDQGLIHPRPQSGYYVRAYAPIKPSEPLRSHPNSVPGEFRRDDLLREMRKEMYRPDIVQLAFATPNPDLLPHGKLARITAQVAREHPELSYGYTNTQGLRALREQVALRAFVAGAVVSPEEIVITTGCQEALCLSLMAVCKPGGVVVVDSPCHYGVFQAIQLCGLKALEISTRSNGGICLDDLEAALKRAKGEGNPAQAVLVNPNFHNPLGGLMSDEDKRRLVEVCHRFNVPLIEDDVYGDLGFDDERPKVARAFDPERASILCSSVSKTIAPGFRVGWVIAGKHHLEVERLKHSFSNGSSGLPQLVLAEFLSNGGYDKYLRRARRAYEQNLSNLADAVARYLPKGTRMTQPRGGLVLWVELPSRVDALKVYREAMRQHIFVAPGTLFSTNDQYRNCLRLNGSRWDETIERGVRSLGEICRIVAG